MFAVEDSSVVDRGGTGESSANHRPRFFLLISVAILSVVVVGFAPSFFLRPFGNPLNNATAAQDLPAYIYVHGLVLTIWFLLLVLQPTLVQTGHTRLHRSLGLFGAVVAVCVFGLSWFVTIKSVGRSVAGGIPIERLPLVVIGNLATLVLFAGLFAAAFHARKKPDWHKRSMTAGSIALLAPAFARWPGAEALIPISVIVPQLCFFAAIALFDFRAQRRVHPATRWALVAYLVIIGGAVPFAMSDAGRTLVMGMK